MNIEATVPLGGHASTDVVRAFTKAIIAPGQKSGIEINSKNTSNGWFPIADLIDRRVTFSVRHASDLQVFDADRDDAAEAAEIFQRELTREGMRPVVWASGRPGHRQIVVAVATIATATRIQARARQLGFDHRKVVSRPPLSPHRLRRPVYLVYPATVDQALENLRWHRSPLAPARRLSPRTIERVRHGDPSVRSGSELVHRIAIAAVAKGITADEIFNLLINPIHKGGESLRQRLKDNDAAGRRWFYRYVWPKAEDYIRDHPPTDDRESTQAAIAMIRHDLATWPWKAAIDASAKRGNRRQLPTVTSLRKGMEGVLDRAHRQASLQITLSRRIMTEVGNFGSVSTAARVLKTLENVGWVTLVHPPTFSRAGVYKVSQRVPLRPSPGSPGGQWVLPTGPALPPPGTPFAGEREAQGSHVQKCTTPTQPVGLVRTEGVGHK